MVVNWSPHYSDLETLTFVAFQLMKNDPEVAEPVRNAAARARSLRCSDLKRSALEAVVAPFEVQLK